MAIVEGVFFKAGLYAAAALIGYRHGADVPGLGPAIDSFCTALGGLLNRQARARATRVASGLEELARRERTDFAPIEATLEDLFARHGLQAPELIDLGLDPEKAAAWVRARGEALFTGLDEGQPELISKALKHAYAVIIEDTDFLETAQATVLRALLSQCDTIEGLPSETANAVRALLGGNLLDSGQRLLPPKPRESLLLRAEYDVVPFDPGRQRDLDDLLAWCRGDPAKGIRLISGAGGIGKTRLALELARRLRLDGWHAGFLLRDAEAAPAFAFDELFEENRHLLVVVDYTETRRATIEDLVRRLALHPSLHRRRILLLARSAGEWWDDLRTRDGDVRDLFERLGEAALAVRLGNLAASAEERERSFAVAREAFAKRLDLDNLPPHRSPPDLTQRHFARALFLHIGALASLRGERPETEDELLDWVLRREEGTWRRALEASDLPAAQFFDPFAQGAALVTLAGGAATSADAWSLLRRVPTLADQPSATLEVLTRILASLYPGVGLEHERHAEVAEAAPNAEAPPVQIAGIRPDLLGEQLVDRQMGKLVDAACGDGVTENLIKSALTVLNRLAGRRPASVPWLHAAFTRNADAVAVAALEVAKATSDPIGVELAKWIAEHRRADIAATLYPKLPYPTVALRELALGVTEATVAALRASRENTPNPDAAASLAGALSDLGIRLSALGRREAALAAAEEAVAVYRELAAARPDAFNPDLARSLSNLGVYLSELGRPEAALAAAEEAVAVYRELAAPRPDAFNPDLARSLSNQSDHQAALGRLQDAVSGYAAAISLLRPYFLQLPAAHAGLMAVIVKTYLEKCELARIEPDQAMLGAVLDVLRSLFDLPAGDPGDVADEGLGARSSAVGGPFRPDS